MSDDRPNSYTYEMLARHFNVSMSTVKKWVKNKTIEPSVKIDSVVRFDLNKCIERVEKTHLSQNRKGSKASSSHCATKKEKAVLNRSHDKTDDARPPHPGGRPRKYDLYQFALTVFDLIYNGKSYPTRDALTKAALAKYEEEARNGGKALAVPPFDWARPYISEIANRIQYEFENDM